MYRYDSGFFFKQTFIPAIVERGYQPIIVDSFDVNQESDYRKNFMPDNSFFEPYNPIYLTNKRDINELVEELKQYDIEAIIAGSDARSSDHSLHGIQLF